ncbi:ABC transporter permease [Bacillus cereus]|uniref:ABC transporter permease n=1 Tax=Bacillus cereus group TaxID=86661 RepID=UPI00303EB928
MNPLFHYLYKCNKRSIAILYFVFITSSLLLLFHVKGSIQIMNSARQDLTLVIFLILLCIASFYVFLLALSSFNKMIKNPMIRCTAITSPKNIYANLFFFTLVFLILLVIGLIFLYYLSLSIDGVKIMDDSFQQEFYELFKYGIFHHIFAVFLWGIDFMYLLVSGYFIIVITKQFPVKESIGRKIFFIVFFFIFIAVQTVLMDVLGGLERDIITIKKNGFIDQNGFIETSFYPSEMSTITDQSFTCLLILLLVAITGRIIDKKLEL